MMKNLNYVNMFNHGIGEVQDLLKEKQSPAAEFNVGLVTAFSAIVREPVDTETIHKNLETQQKNYNESNDFQRELPNVLKDVLKDVHKDMLKELTERQIIILETICTSPDVTQQGMSTKLKVSKKTIQREFDAIRNLGINIDRQDGRKEGEWVIRIEK